MGNDIKIDKKIFFPHSLGIFYQAITQYLGFKNYGDEYKIMGLSPYGNPKYLKKLREMIWVGNKSILNWDKKFFNLKI